MSSATSPPPDAALPRAADYLPAADGDPIDWIVAIGRHRDRTGFAALFVHFAPKVKGYFLRFAPDDARAEELTQDTFLLIWRKAHLFDPGRASVAGWIFTIARNLRVDALRHERVPGDIRSPPAADAPETPEQALQSRQGEAQLRQALARLSDAQAQIVLLAYFEDWSHSEIADRLGIPLGTVKSRLRLAAAQLRSDLDSMS